MSPSARTQSHFKTVQKFSATYAPATFSQYESTRTGMRVAVVDRKGPKVSGYFALATEIHDDAGVVYSEMQGVQNTQGELMELQARRLLYPEGNGFRYETGGMMDALRVLTAHRIRDFHKEMYQPKNLCVVLIGEVDHLNLLEI